MTLDPSVAAVRLAVRRELVRGSKAEPWVPGTDTVLVACSGGADSLALLAATVFELKRAPVRVVGAVVDHGLQDGSADHTARVVAQMARLGVDETVSARVQVDPGGLGPEAAAREARYEVLDQMARHFGAPTVLLGHTLDDQAETVLLGLTRGSGGRSLAGMRPAFMLHEGQAREWSPVQDPIFRRPLLGVRRAQTEAACRAEGIEFWTDPHNADQRFTRARVRRTVLPMLERELGPGVVETLARTAEQLRPDMEALDDLAAAEYAARRRPEGLDVDTFHGVADALRPRLVRQAALDAGSPASELFHVHVKALLGLVASEGQVGEIQLPGHVTAYVEGDLLRFRPTAPPPGADH
ncbi:tRNA lysidine(34) synthetase TilS [Nocardioides rubriscoriae]|uniref:tRNA lysidine(34) synthetase TilS n=1 Tax=Nocardioides rubriscoriae TaxID=642762 RepID=UPI0011DFE197|nr:tRNA lysidine(34) synthetase TilS [Nocardioides rubriscoriae]